MHHLRDFEEAFNEKDRNMLKICENKLIEKEKEIVELNRTIKFYENYVQL